MFRRLVIPVLLLAVLILLPGSADAVVQRPPEKVTLMPDVVEEGSAFMVSVDGAEPESVLTVTFRDASMPTYLVPTDGSGYAFFAVGVPCGLTHGLLRMNVGGMMVSVVVREGKTCRRYSDWMR